MKKFTPFLLTAFLMLGTVACSQDARTGAGASNSANNNTAQTDDNNNDIRQAQIESDRRAREQRALNSNEPSGDVRSAQVESDRRAGEQRSMNDNNGAQTGANDATSNIRQGQIESDERANQQRDNMAANPQAIADDNLETQVRDKLAANFPSNNLSVDAENGIVTISGTAFSQEELDRVESLAKEVPGVQEVNVKATAAPSNP